MSHILLVLLLLVVSGAVLAMPDAEARHLLSRTGFGGDAEEIQYYSTLNYEHAVAHLLEQSNVKTEMSPPAWLFEPLKIDRKRMKNASVEQRKAFRMEQRKKGLELKGWWYAEMVNTDSPFTEKMTLFWHNHFTSSLQKIKQPILLYRQNVLFRKYALGNFKELTHAICRDSAMLGYLDNFKSSKQAPNENFARELLELFALGEGNYTELDIKEAARAFTGWSIDRNTGEFRFYKQRHDFGKKKFLGKSGAFNGEDIVNIIFEQPETATFLVNKLWLEFISESPNKAEIDRLAKIFRANNYEMKPLMHELLISKDFRRPANYGRLIKSPVDFIVGTLRIFEIPVQDGRVVAFSGAHLGQNLFDPPNVKGWPGGNEWITSSSLLSRQQLLERMFRGNGAEMSNRANGKFALPKILRENDRKVDLRPFIERFIKTHDKQKIINVLLVEDAINVSSTTSATGKLNTNDILALMSDPIYQLK